MATLDSKLIEVKDMDTYVALGDTITSWLPSFAFLEGKNVIITVATGDGKRIKKLNALRILDQLVSENSNAGEVSWKYGEYKFLFLTRSYWWKGCQIHLTSAEALAIYRFVILKDKLAAKEFYWLLSNARKRLGKDFLADLLREENPA